MNKGRVIYDGCYDLADNMMELLLNESIEYGITFVGDADDTAEVLKALINIDEDDVLIFGDVELEACEFRAYDGPYLLSLDEEGQIWCEKAMSKDGDRIIGFDSEYIFIRPEYKKYVDADWYHEADITEVVFDGEEIEPDREGKLGIITNDDGTPCGFTFQDKDGGRCVDVTYCTCGSFDPDVLMEKMNSIIEALLK